MLGPRARPAPVALRSRWPCLAHADCCMPWSMALPKAMLALSASCRMEHAGCFNNACTSGRPMKPKGRAKEGRSPLLSGHAAAHQTK